MYPHKDIAILKAETLENNAISNGTKSIVAGKG